MTPSLPARSLPSMLRARATPATTSPSLSPESLVPERLRTPRRSSPTSPPSAPPERGRRARPPLRTRLSRPTLSLRLGQRQDREERQLFQVRKVHPYPLQLLRKAVRSRHGGLPAREVPPHLPAASRALLPRLLQPDVRLCSRSEGEVPADQRHQGLLVRVSGQADRALH